MKRQQKTLTKFYRVLTLIKVGTPVSHALKQVGLCDRDYYGIKKELENATKELARGPWTDPRTVGQKT